MPNYKNGKIYKLYSMNEPEKVYYGSTTQTLPMRKSGHKATYKRYLGGKGNFCSSFDIFKMDNVEIELVEKCPCEDKDELLIREKHYIKSFDCVNKQIPKNTRKEYYNDNKDKYATNIKKYHKKIPDKLKENNKRYYDKHRDKILAKGKQKRLNLKLKKQDN